MKQEREDEVGWEVVPSLITKETYEKISSLDFISWHTCPGLCGLQGK